MDWCLHVLRKCGAVDWIRRLLSLCPAPSLAGLSSMTNVDECELGKLLLRKAAKSLAGKLVGVGFMSHPPPSLHISPSPQKSFHILISFYCFHFLLCWGLCFKYHPVRDFTGDTWTKSYSIHMKGEIYWAKFDSNVRSSWDCLKFISFPRQLNESSVWWG